MKKIKFNDIYKLHILDIQDITLLLEILYRLEDRQQYNNKKLSKLIDYLQTL